MQIEPPVANNPSDAVGFDVFIDTKHANSPHFYQGRQRANVLIAGTAAAFLKATQKQFASRISGFALFRQSTYATLFRPT